MSVPITLVDQHFAVSDVDEAFNRLVTVFGTEKSIRWERPAQNTLVMVRRFTPGWAVLLAIIGIFLFLLGLLFLLVKDEERVTIIARADGNGGASYTVTGRTTKEIAGVLEQYFAV